MRDQRKKLKQVMTICIFGVAHAFDPDEIIFDLEMKNDTPNYDLTEAQTNCFACQIVLKKPVQCEFCAMKYCSECRTRSRAFPRSIQLDNGEKIMGKICKICDRKFLMLEKYKNEMMPNGNRNEDLRHQVQSFEMKLHKSEYLTNIEANVTEELCQKQNEHRLEKLRIQTSAELHADSIKRGEGLMTDIERNTQVQMVELQKDRCSLNNIDLELQFLQDELKNY